MTLSLAPELQRFVDEQVREGKFATADAAIAEAVRLMKEREEKLESLRKDIRVGIEAAERRQFRQWDAASAKARLDARLAREGR